MKSMANQYIASMIRMRNFNENYEYILEQELAEMNTFLSQVSDTPSLIYDYVSTNVNGTTHKWC
jgi:nitrate/nitrite-specific signal transduction histidine kinase